MTISANNRPIAGGYAKKVTWLALTVANDTGDAITNTEFNDRSVQVSGTWGTGGEITIQGSNDGGATWSTLTDPQGNSLVITESKIEAIMEISEYIRPVVTGGDGTTSLDVYLVTRGNV